MNAGEIFQNAGLRVRESQLKMVEVVRQAVEEDRNAIISAGTGVGKTFAYLVGAWLGMSDLEKKHTLVVSTNTVALQEQLIQKDLPFLEKLLNEKISFTLVKGRNRYLCHRRFETIMVQPEQQEEIDNLRKQLTRGWDGDVDELPRSPHYSLWQEINNTSATCSHKKCSFYTTCPFFNARRNLKKFDIVVVNHSLLMSHLLLGDGAILPKFEKSVLVVDECHHLAQKALDSFAAQASLIASQEWLKDIDKTIREFSEVDINQSQRQELANAQDELGRSLREAQFILHQLYQQNDTTTEKIVRLKSLPDVLLEVGNKIRTSAMVHVEVLQSAKKALDDQAEDGVIYDQKIIERRYTAVGFLLERAKNLHQLWLLIITTDDPPIAKWFYPKIAPDQGESDLVGIMQDYKVCASYIEAGDMLDDLLWQQVEHSVILCSATVKSMGNFKRFIDSTGIDPKTQQIDLPSPFPYWKSQLFIPNMKYNPKSSIQHIKESSEQIRAALSTTTKGVMVLFTSMYAMREVFEKLPINIQSHIIMQGEQSKSVILAKHKKMIDKKSRSIIFGVDSFAEGVDLMGDYLTLLIIHKLPFAVPSNPIEKTRSEWLESKNKKPFFEVSLPTASIKLTQMVGRLIRDEDDQGIVIILDTRLKTKRYGQEMLRNLPRFKIVNNIQEV